MARSGTLSPVKGRIVTAFPLSNRTHLRCRAAASACAHVLVTLSVTLTAMSIADRGAASPPTALDVIKASVDAAETSLSPSGLDGDYEGAVAESSAPALDDDGRRAPDGRGSTLTHALVRPDIPPELIS